MILPSLKSGFEELALWRNAGEWLAFTFSSRKDRGSRVFSRFSRSLFRISLDSVESDARDISAGGGRRRRAPSFVGVGVGVGDISSESIDVVISKWVCCARVGDGE